MGKMKNEGKAPQAAEAPASAPPADDEVTLTQLERGSAIGFKLNPRLYKMVREELPRAAFDREAQAWVVPHEDAAETIKVVERMRAEQKAGHIERETLMAELDVDHPGVRRGAARTVPQARGGDGKVLPMRYRGEVVAVTPRFVAQKVVETPHPRNGEEPVPHDRIIVHERAALFKAAPRGAERNGQLDPAPAPEVGRGLDIAYFKGMGFANPVAPSQDQAQGASTRPRQAQGARQGAPAPQQGQGSQEAAPQRGARQAPKARPKQTQGMAQ